MSQHLVPRTATARGHAARMLLLAAVGALLVTVAASWLGLSYLRVLSSDTAVRAELPTLGDSLGPGSDVKYRGLVVGKVQHVRRGDGSKSAELLIDPEQTARIPADVRARVLPGTLFGSEYVELVEPRGSSGSPGAGSLSEGAVVPADTSRRTVRLMNAFGSVERLLTSVDPAQIDAVTSNLARALDGRGDDLGRFLVRADRLVGEVAAHEDTFYRDLELLEESLGTAGEIEPALVAALRSSTTTANTVVARREELAELVTGSTALADRSGRLLTREEDKLVRLLGATGPVLSTVAAETGSLERLLAGAPVVLHNGASSITGSRIMMEGLIGTNPLDPYTAADCPRYAGVAAGSNCAGSDGRYDVYRPAGARDAAGRPAPGSLGALLAGPLRHPEADR